MKVKPGKGNEFARMFERDIASSSVKLKGLRRLYLLRSVKKEDDFVVLSLWDSEEDASRYASGGQFSRNATKLAKFLTTKQRVSKFSVEVHGVGESFNLDK